MIRVIADDKIPFLKGILEQFAEVEYHPGNKITNSILSGADALLIRTRTKCTEALLAGTSVKFIATATIGFDHIDTQYCQKAGITWTNAPGCNSGSVKQYIAAALLKLAKDFRFSLEGKTIGIVGAGNVGSKVEKFCRTIGMNVLVNDPPRARKEGEKGFVDLNTLLAESDIVTLHVPLTVVGEDKTYHLVNERLIKKMKKGAWLINSSRGEVADTLSLKKALSSQRVSGTILDVWEHEPDIDIELMQNTFISTPHIAGYSTDGKANGTAMIVNSLSEFFRLPLTGWYPSGLPEPVETLININCKGKTKEEVIREAVEFTYNIGEDDLRLRFSPSDFEKQRGEYPMRREFGAYSVELTGGNKKLTGILKETGFKIK